MTALTEDDAMAVLQSKGRSFYFAGRLLTPLHRNRAARLYAFCRYVDDIADETDDSVAAAHRLEQIKHSILMGVSTDARVSDMLRLMHEAKIPSEPVTALIDGVYSDVRLDAVTSEEQLVRYAYQVAGTVGLMMSMVLDVHDRDAFPFAIDLGIAMQLTNIARDVAEDACNGRVYLPQSWIGPVQAEQVITPDLATKTRLREGVQRTLALAQNYYDSGLSGVRFLPSSARYGIVVAAMVYREIGEVIAASDYHSWQQRAVVSHSRKLVCASRALTWHAIHNFSGTFDTAHDGRLHEHLQDCFGANAATLV